MVLIIEKQAAKHLAGAVSEARAEIIARGGRIFEYIAARKGFGKMPVGQLEDNA
jgi:hypothetical protein